MASEEPPNPMTESGVTIASDSEQYNSGVEDLSASAPSSSPPDVVLYKRPTIWSILRGAAINLLLPFINGMMLGFGELFAHEAAFRLGWSNTRVSAAPCRRRCLGFFWGARVLTLVYRSSPFRGVKRTLLVPESRRSRSRGGRMSLTEFSHVDLGTQRKTSCSDSCLCTSQCLLLNAGGQWTDAACTVRRRNLGRLRCRWRRRRTKTVSGPLAGGSTVLFPAAAYTYIQGALLMKYT